MKKNRPFMSFFYFVVCITTYPIWGCSGDTGDSPEKKANLSLASKDTKDLYDMLEDYPGLESLFTAGDMTISEFEDQLFGNFLGDAASADAIIYVKDSLPNFIGEGTSTMSIFSPEVQMEMESKGVLPDFLGSFSVLSEGVMALEEEKKDALYKYFDQLAVKRKSSGDNRRIWDYLADILHDIFSYLGELDDEEANLMLETLVEEFMRLKVPEDGKLDFVDIDMLLEKFAGQAPDGFVEFFEGLRLLLDDKEFQDTFTEMGRALGAFLGDDRAYSLYKAFFINMHNNYTKEEFGEILERMWDEGPLVGPEIEKMDIVSHYGVRQSEDKYDYALQEFFLHPKFITEVLETLYHFREEGYSLAVWDTFIRMMERDIFGAPLDSPATYGNGEFYEPNDHLSYQNVSALRGAFAMANRWNVPFTALSPFLYSEPGAPRAKQETRLFFSDADRLNLGAMVWVEVWEKDPDKYMGSGHRVTEKRGYGIMRNGVYLAPLYAGLDNICDIGVAILGDSVLNGPYDNIYDNLNWLFYERKLEIILDLPQFIERAWPAVHLVTGPIFKVLGIEHLHLTILKRKGAMAVVNLELTELFERVVNAVTRGLLPNSWGWAEDYDPNLINAIPTWVWDKFWVAFDFVFRTIWPVVTSAEDNVFRAYLLPKDVRELCVLGYQLSFYDEDAFHYDKMLDESCNPYNYTYFYDTRDYTYKTHPDKANRIVNFAAPLCVASYKLFSEAVEGIPKTLLNTEAIAHRAKKELGIADPFGYLLNTLTALTEFPTETNVYDVPDHEIAPLLGYLEPLFKAEKYGFFDNLFEVLAVMGKPELKEGREKLLNGFAQLLATIPKDTGSAYTLASEVHRIVGTAMKDKDRWDAYDTFLEIWNHLLDTDSPNEILTDWVAFSDYMVSVGLTDKEYTRAAEGVSEIFEKGTRERFITRSLIHLTDFFDELDQHHEWEKILDALEIALSEDDGVLSYVFRGLEKDPNVSWGEIMEDTDRFLHSDIVNNFEEGSFWMDIYNLLDFLSDAIVEDDS